MFDSIYSGILQDFWFLSPSWFPARITGKKVGILEVALVNLAAGFLGVMIFLHLG